MRIRWNIGFAAVLLIVGQTVFAAERPSADCESFLKGDHRPAAEQARDDFRHPCATLAFFEVGPEQTVVEIWPGAGWYTAVLAPLLREHGQLYTAHWRVDSDVEYFRKGRANFERRLAEKPNVYDRVRVSILEPPRYVMIAPPGSADRVLTFRNVHNWVKADTAEAVFAAMFRVLKPGGILGVVEHRASPDTSLETMIESGYVTEARVTMLAEGAGFQFVEASEINANPKDDRDHPKGVWTLPPSLRLGETDRERYLAIGESDRMTLKFVKPAAANNDE